MPDFVFFLLLFLLLILMVNSSIIGAYYTTKTAWVYPISLLKIIYQSDNNLNNLYFLVKKPLFFYLISFFIFNLLNLGGLAIFIWIWLLVSNNMYYIIGFIIIIILTIIPNYILILNIIKKIKAIGLYSQTEIASNFKKYQLDFNNKLNVIEFEIFEFNKPSMQNKGFHFNQKRYKRKIKQLKAKNLSDEQYNFQLLNMYRRYLTAHLLFLKSIHYKSLKNIEMNKNSYVLINNQKKVEITELKNILVNNFLAYVQE